MFSVIFGVLNSMLIYTNFATFYTKVVEHIPSLIVLLKLNWYGEILTIVKHDISIFIHLSKWGLTRYAVYTLYLSLVEFTNVILLSKTLQQNRGIYRDQERLFLWYVNANIYFDPEHVAAFAKAGQVVPYVGKPSIHIVNVFRISLFMPRLCILFTWNVLS